MIEECISNNQEFNNIYGKALKGLDISKNDKFMLSEEGDLSILWRSYFKASEEFENNFKTAIYIEACEEIADLYSIFSESLNSNQNYIKRMYEADIKKAINSTINNNSLYEKLLEKHTIKKIAYTGSLKGEKYPKCKSGMQIYAEMDYEPTTKLLSIKELGEVLLERDVPTLDDNFYLNYVVANCDVISTGDIEYYLDLGFIYIN